MENLTTKQKIIYSSLELFSKDGYDGVSMRQIASSVGIKGASIYSHFKSKQDIFVAIFEEMKSRYDSLASNLMIPTMPNSDAANFFKQADEQILFKMTEGLFSLYTQDRLIMMFRKLLFSEQNKNELVAKYLQEYYLNAPIQFQSDLLSKMQTLGIFKDYHVQTMAMHFYSPIFYTLCAYDLGKEYDECLIELKNHVHQFCRIYK